VAAHGSPDAGLMAWRSAPAALADMAFEIETDRLIGGLLFFAYHVMAMGVYLRNRRPQLTRARRPRSRRCCC
jgi:hypothetical protein